VNFPEQMMARLKAAQSAFAIDALRRPQQRDTFEYGYRVGVVEGYEAAINVLIQLLKEERDGDRDI